MKSFVDYIAFFNSLTVDVRDISTSTDIENRQRRVKAIYHYKGKAFETKDLFYKEISGLSDVKNIDELHDFFEEDVYWLDIDRHDWPKPKGQTDINTLIIDDITDDIEFAEFLKLLANNESTGYIQKITEEGRSNQYYRNLENNNHWHDLVLLIKEYINNNGEEIDKNFFRSLVFKWDGNKNTDRLRSSLSSYFGNRSLVSCLQHNIKLNSKYFSDKEEMDNLINLLTYKKQIILQGPPGTGKTRLAKEIAKEILGVGKVEDLTNHDQFKIVQFHPSYTYEDFVRGIITVPSADGQGVLYEVENKVLADFAQRAFEDSNNNYVLIIDEINRANLSSVLGELIYALEYREEEVESMYGIKGDKKLVLPSNLYIIGTMNTADRSVGYIDYAIRRRFAFVDVLPEKLEDSDEIYFNGVGFDAVSSLFIQENISKEFEIKDVQIGHSYFIAKKKEVTDIEAAQEIFALKMQYEILPILREYIKDGILIGDGILEKVETLQTKL